MPTQPPTVYPALFYRDADAAIAFLGQAFGFEKLMVHRDGSLVVHAELRLGNAVVMPSTAKPERGWKSPLDLGGVNQSVYIALDDVDAHHARATEAGAEIVHPLADTEYGSREYGAKDPEGHFWHFGTYVPGSPAA
jgi:uncharacterized glyoxalase superfamily protein PhnB